MRQKPTNLLAEQQSRALELLEDAELTARPVKGECHDLLVSFRTRASEGISLRVVGQVQGHFTSRSAQVQLGGTHAFLRGLRQVEGDGSEGEAEAELLVCHLTRAQQGKRLGTH